MVISFSSFQCKRAYPPEVEDVIKIRERRSRRERSIEDVKPLRAFGKSEFEPLKGYSVWSEPIGDISFTSLDGSIVPPANPIHIDPLTHKQFKAPNPNEKDIGDMFRFYGIDAEIYECPVCDLKGTLRTLLPHLNNIDRNPDVFYSDESEYLGELAPKVDKPVSEELVMTPSGRSFIGTGIIVQPIRSHGWNFKQLGEWLETLGH